MHELSVTPAVTWNSAWDVANTQCHYYLLLLLLLFTTWQVRTQLVALNPDSAIGRETLG